MEVIEGASNKTPRKRTPPSSEDMKKKALIRSLGRKPSEDKIALYVRKTSNDSGHLASKPEPAKLKGEVKLREKKPPLDDSKKNQFLQDMARRSLEVPTDFLDKIDEEKKSADDNRLAMETNNSGLNKKYPFNRTTTPNTLREHLKETLAKNLGSSTDLAETMRFSTRLTSTVRISRRRLFSGGPSVTRASGYRSKRRTRRVILAATSLADGRITSSEPSVETGGHWAIVSLQTGKRRRVTVTCLARAAAGLPTWRRSLAVDCSTGSQLLARRWGAARSAARRGTKTRLA